MTDIEKTTVPAQAIVSITHEHVRVDQLPALIGPGFMEIGGYLESQPAEIADAPFVAFYGMDESIKLDENDMRVEIGFPIRAAIAADARFAQYERASFEAARVVYTGDYNAGMMRVYQDIASWLAERGIAFPGLAYECYLTGEDVPLDEQITVITVPFEVPKRLG